MQVCEISTKYGLAVLLALLASDPDIGGRGDRILLVSNNSADPEAEDELLSFALKSPAVAAVFRGVESLNRLLGSQHPTQWKLPEDELHRHTLRALLTAVFRTERVDSVVMESIQTPPSNTLARVFSDADLHVYADGLMTYGPTRFALPADIGCRIRTLHFVEFLKGADPAYLREFRVERRPVEPGVLRESLRSLSTASRDDLAAADLDGAPVFLGQYLAGLGLYTVEEEIDLYARGMRATATAAKSNTVFFKPHPTFAPGLVNSLVASPLLDGLDVRVLAGGYLIEEFLLHHRPSLVCSVFSTGLASARELFGIPCYRFATRQFIGRLKPYENSNRIPAVVVAYAFPDITSRGSWFEPAPDLQGKIDLIAASMQPGLLIRTPEAKESLLATPVDEGDDLERAARDRVAKFSPKENLSSEERFLVGLGAPRLVAKEQQPVTAPSEPERPIDQAKRLVSEGRFEEAFFISLGALQSSPNSTKHMEILNRASIALGGLYRKKFEMVTGLYDPYRSKAAPIDATPGAEAETQGLPSNESIPPAAGEPGAANPEAASPT
jgi:hypothetical protein